MYLQNKKGKVLCSYSTDESGKSIIGIEDILIPNDFNSIKEWIEYSKEINEAIINLRLEIK